MPAPLPTRQMELPFRLPLKDWFTLREAASLCGMSESYLEKKFDEGTQLNGHVHNAGTGQRVSKRIPRAWLVVFMVSTSRYDVDSLADAYVAAAKHFEPATLRRVIHGLGALN